MVGLIAGLPAMIASKYAWPSAVRFKIALTRARRAARFARWIARNDGEASRATGLLDVPGDEALDVDDEIERLVGRLVDFETRVERLSHRDDARALP